MRTRFFIGLLFCAQVAFAQNILTTIMVAPDISPFLADWREDATAVYVRIDNFGGEEIPEAIARATVTGIKNGQVVEAKSVIFTIPKDGSITLYGNDKLLDVRSVSFMGDMLRKIQASNRIPDDHYDICVEVLRLPDEHILSTSCTQFDIRAASAPLLLSPPDGDIVMVKYPLFQWIPTRTTNKMEAHYTLAVRPLRDFQTPQQSFESATVMIFDKTDVTLPTVQMTTDAMEIEDGRSYVWQVQAFDRSGKPLGENDGKSEVFTFTYMTPESFHRMQAQKDSLNAKADSTK